jgi:tripartite-type tricarboxylate transporter receptor subunit TctC
MSSAATLNLPITSSAANYDAMRDLRPIAIIGRSPAVIVTAAHSRFTDIGKLLTESREKPGSVSFATYSNSYRMAVLALGRTHGPSFNLISYKGFSPATTDIIGGVTDVGIVDAGAALPLIQAGKLRALAATSSKRVPELPSVPTLQEKGFAGYQFYGWVGLSVRSHTPEPVVRRLEQEVAKIVATPEFHHYLTSRSTATEVIGLIGPQAVKENEREAARLREIASQWKAGQS